MKLSILFCIINISFSRVNGLIHIFIPCNNKINKITHQISLFLCDEKRDIPKKKQSMKIQEKINEYQRWIRYKNIAPTILLCFSGGWILHPSVSLFSNRLYWLSTIETVFIMMTSMMINDVFNIEIDKINYVDSPFITVEISKMESIIHILGMTGFIEIINTVFFPESLQIIVHIATITIFVYTPIFKKITMMKNIVCAGLISFSLFYTGLSILAESKEWINIHPNFDLFAILFQIIFLGSFLNELMLDIYAYEGDKENHIRTIPVVFGKKMTWYLLTSLFGFNMISSTLSMMYILQGNPLFCILPIIFSTGIPSILNITYEKFSCASIYKTTNQIQTILFFLVLYFCTLATFRYEIV